MFRLALFDIDCTLIEPHGTAVRAVFAAVEETYGVRGELDGYAFHGRTDPGIMVDLATRWGAPAVVAAARRQECLEHYVVHLRAEVAAGGIEVNPGVRELVTALAADRRVLLGLLTGNVAAGADIKLAPTGLRSLFKVGAYGSDSALRSDLPAIAIARAAALAGRRYCGKEVAIIGDSPADITCGAAEGVKTIAVTTGRHTHGELAALAPDYLFADFTDWRAAYEAILA
jgi:phosphoglycolate phosphatase-like HAD superfamily hydrolase